MTAAAAATTFPEDDRPPRTLSDWLARELRGEIRMGRLPGGTHLRQTEIAGRYGVSSTPVREAFAALQREGLLTSEPHKGVYVFSPTVDDLRENYEIRIELESHATAKAVPNLTDDDLARMRLLLDEMAPLSFENDNDRYFELNEALHDTIYAAAGRPRLAALIVQLREEPASLLGLFGGARVHLDVAESKRQHEAIYVACARRDAVGAAEAMGDHLHGTLDRIARGLASG